MMNFSNQSYSSMYPTQGMYLAQNNKYTNQSNMYPVQNNMLMNQNATYNNMFLTQNYCQPTNNITNIINNYYQVIQQQPTASYAPVQQNCFQTANYGNQYMMSCNNYSYQQQSGDNMLSMLMSLITSLFGSVGNNQTHMQQIIPTFNYNNSSQNSINDSLGILYDAFEEFLNSNDKVEEYEDDVNVSSSATGDPHFGINGQQAFDFQGVNNGIYKMLDNKDISLTAKFTGTEDISGARIIHDQNLTFKDSDINIISHAGGTFEILEDGKKIGDQTNYKTDENVIKILKENDINVDFEGSSLKVTHDKRSLTQTIGGGNINNTDETLMKGDTGLLSQTVGANDNDHDGKMKWTTDINKDGKVDDNDTVKYDLSNQLMVHTEISGSSCNAITTEIEAAIKKDIQVGADQGSIVKGYSADHGYDARQWNEYIGMKLFTTTDKLLSV